LRNDRNCGIKKTVLKTLNILKKERRIEMAKRLKNAGDIIIPIVFSLAIIIGVGVHAGAVFGLGAAVVYVLVFSLITGFLFVLSQL